MENDNDWGLFTVIIIVVLMFVLIAIGSGTIIIGLTT